MTYDPERHHRRSLRLKGYDYTHAGAYFVTICTQNRECLFGEVVDGEMRLNDAGRMVEKWWAELNNKFPNIETDENIVMPNHFHGIVVIAADRPGLTNGNVGADLRVCPESTGANDEITGAHTGAPLRGAPLPEIVQWFKTMTTNEYIRGVKTLDWPPFRGRIWQSNYYEHIIRDEASLNRIREYIANNPMQWALDRENPVRATHASPLPKDEPWQI